MSHECTAVYSEDVRRGGSSLVQRCSDRVEHHGSGFSSAWGMCFLLLTGSRTSVGPRSASSSSSSNPKRHIVGISRWRNGSAIN